MAQHQKAQASEYFRGCLDPSPARFEVAYRPIPKGFKQLAGDKRSAITGFGRKANMIPKGSQRAFAAIPSGSNRASLGFRRWSLRSTSG
jgi:hypothetical protein